jgi:hypothetical protein
MEPGRRAVIESREAWLETLKAAVVTDEVFYLGDRGTFEPVLVKALPLTDAILAKAAALWPDDQRLKAALAQWRGKGRAVVLVGLYAPNLKSSPADFLKSNPFALSLQFPGVAPTPSDPPVLVDKEVVDDFFPVFNRWDKALAYSFKSSLGPGTLLAVSWPTGKAELDLTPPPAAADN